MGSRLSLASNDLEPGLRSKTEEIGMNWWQKIGISELIQDLRMLLETFIRMPINSHSKPPFQGFSSIHSIICLKRKESSKFWRWELSREVRERKQDSFAKFAKELWEVRKSKCTICEVRKTSRGYLRISLTYVANLRSSQPQGPTSRNP
jgi:hypothetical protein